MIARLILGSFFVWQLATANVGVIEGHSFFEKKVRPILEEHCLKCHSEEKKVKGGLLLDRKAGWEEGGDSGAVIVPGKADESLLIQMVRHDPEVEAMPPKSKLSGGELAVLIEWVEMGAPDPRDEPVGVALKKSGFQLEERMKWWSLQAVKEVEVPEVKNDGWAREDLDRFILAELEKKGWDPAKEAERATLLRRVSVVLTGLAPTLEELDLFLKDAEEGAYERAVDRLMASPHFGEQWARHWMDVVRYGESKAFENDYWMPHTWKYRDYLIRAFNNDVPFDQFVREALAGDLLEQPRLDPETGNNESVAGPGFLYLADGHHGVVDLHEDEARVIDSMINVVGTAFHGLTISCARCHDHKFDAITDEDYYSMYGMFRSSPLHYANAAEVKWTPEREGKLAAAHDEVVKLALKSSQGRVGELSELVKGLRELAKDHTLRERWGKVEAGAEEEKVLFLKELRERSSVGIAHWFEVLYGRSLRPELAGLKDLVEAQEVASRKQAVLPERSWMVEGAGMKVVEGRKGGRFLVGAKDPRVIHAAVGSGMVGGDLSSRLDGTVRSEDFVLDGNPVDIWVKGRSATVSLVIRNHELVGHGPTTGRLRQNVETDQWRLFRFPTNLWAGEVAFLQVQHQGAAKRVLSPRAGGVAPNDEAWVAVASELPEWGQVWRGKKSVEDVIEGLLSGPKSGAEAEVLGALFGSGLLKAGQSAEIEKSLSLLSELREQVEEPVYVRSLAEGTCRDEPVYIRGNHKRPSEKKNPRHFLMGLGGDLMTGAGSGRSEWAEKILDPANPLTARVRVNRIWSRIFGRGLVGSVDDFGKMGEKPSHPELLDFLARDFVAEEWSTKAMVRKMVLSSTFRMSSVPTYEAAEMDPGNVYLQRMALRRMSAESIRDHILASTGELKAELFGPSILAYVDDQPSSRAFPARGPLGGDGRRSIYLASRRNYLSSFLRAFDAPNASEPVGKRNVTTVPAQSLALLNHPLVHQQAKIWGERMLSAEGSNEGKLKQLHRVAFSREASVAEVEWGISALERLSEGASLQEAWTSLCHIFMNRKEFIYVL